MGERRQLCTEQFEEILLEVLLNLIEEIRQKILSFLQMDVILQMIRL